MLGYDENLARKYSFSISKRPFQIIKNKFNNIFYSLKQKREELNDKKNKIDEKTELNTKDLIHEIEKKDEIEPKEGKKPKDKIMPKKETNKKSTKTKEKTKLKKEKIDIKSSKTKTLPNRTNGIE